MPTQVTNYQCPACTGPLHFSAETGKLTCDYCGSAYDVAEIEALYAQKEAEAAAAKEAADAKAEAAKADAADDGGWDTSDLSSDWGADADGLRVYGCPSCGAELICDETTAATSCPYCGNPTVVPGQFSGALKPEFVLPFKMTKDDAVRALRAHYRGKPFLPRSFTAGNHIEEIQGVYVPFWLFDGGAEGEVDYKAANSRTYRDDDYEVTETDHYDVHRGGSIAFEKIPVDASSKMPRPRRPPQQRDARKRPARDRDRLRHVRDRPHGHPPAPRQGALRPAAGVDAEHEVERRKLPLRHERTDRQACRRPADRPRPLLGHVRCDRRRGHGRADGHPAVYVRRRTS